LATFFIKFFSYKHRLFSNKTRILFVQAKLPQAVVIGLQLHYGKARIAHRFVDPINPMFSAFLFIFQVITMRQKSGYRSFAAYKLDASRGLAGELQQASNGHASCRTS